MLENLSVQEIVSHILSKKISPEEVADYYLNRIRKLNPVLNAIVSLKDEDLIKDEVKHIIKNIDSYKINPPVLKRERLERLYDLSRMVFADNIADEAEKELMLRLVIGLGFEQNEANSVMEKSFKEIIKGSDEDEFIAAF